MFYDHFNVKRHIKTEHEKSERCACTECEKSFSNQYSLNYHVKACHKKDSCFTCLVCEETFKTIAGLCKHKKSAHTKKVTIKCRYCEINLNSRSNLNRHKQEIHCKGTRFDTSRIKVSLYSFACDQCDFVAKRKFHLLRHVKNKHETDEQSKNLSGEEKKTCPTGNKIFCNKSNLKRHVVSVHETESAQGVNDDSASYSNEHKEIIKKQCYYCEKMFVCKNLWRHIEEVHGKTK